MVKKLSKQIKEITKVNVLAGLGGVTIGKIHSVGGYGNAGALSGVGKYTPVITSAAMGTGAMRIFRSGLKRPKKRRRK